MGRPLDALEQVCDVVQIEACPNAAKVARVDRERPGTRRASVQEAPSDRIVHDVAERPARSPRLRPQLRRHVLIKRQRRPHTKMLGDKHHDVN